MRFAITVDIDAPPERDLALEAAGLKRRSERETEGPPPRTWETSR